MPTSVTEAVKMLAANVDAVPISGGTDLMVHWPSRLDRHEWVYVDLSGVDELRGHRWDEDALVLGGRSTYWDVICDERAWDEFPVLVRAARQVGAVQIQTRGTWAGNIAHASPAADGVPALMACDAVVVLQSADGCEVLPLSEMYTGYKQKRMRPDQLIVEIRVPRMGRPVQIFEKVGSRSAQAITKIGVTIVLSRLGWRVVASSMAPTVCRCRTIEAMLDASGPAVRPEDYLSAIRSDVSPIDDIRSTAQYRERVMSRVLYAALSAHTGARPQ